MDVNLDRVRKITSEVLRGLRLLEELARLPEEEFRADPHKIASAKYNLIVAIEGVVDLCHHLIARRGFRTPEDYSDTLRVMQEERVIEEEFASTLIQIVRFRNRLVHIYWDVDVKEIYRILQTRLEDIHRFLREFAVFLDRAKNLRSL